MKKHTGDNQGDYYYGHDHLYSVCVLFESDGDLADRYEYDACGKAYVMDASYGSRSTSSYDNRYAFTGRELASLPPPHAVASHLDLQPLARIVRAPRAGSWVWQCRTAWQSGRPPGPGHLAG